MINKINKLPDINILKTLFTYNDGKLIRNNLSTDDRIILNWSNKAIKQWNTCWAGKEAGYVFKTTSGSMVMQVRILGKLYYVHRIIFKLCTENEPDLIDHINGDSLDNHITNLRSVDNKTNMKNAKRSVSNTSGITGVSWSTTNNKWEVYIWDNGTKINLGLFSCKDEAIMVRKRAEIDLGYHQNHGRVVNQ